VPVPFTVAVHCEVALTAIVAGVQAGETEMMVGDDEGGDGVSSLLLVLLPHAVSASKSRVRPEA
jgi:hypothetical protein